MAHFDFDEMENYEIDRSPFDAALRRHGKLSEPSRLGWLVEPESGPPIIVVSKGTGGRLTVYDTWPLPGRMRSALKELQDYHDTMLDRLALTVGAERQQLERAIVMVCTLLDTWAKALSRCVASEQHVGEIGRFVVEKLRGAVEAVDLRVPETFWGLVHEFHLEIKGRIGDGCCESADGPIDVCHELAPDPDASAA